MNLIRCFEKNEEFTAIDATPGSSVIALQEFINKGFISKERVNDLIKNHYLNHIKVADYTINENNALTHYTHAPSDDNLISRIAKQFNLEYDFESATKQKECLDELEVKFQNNYVKKGLISTLVTNPPKTAIFQSIWNRNRFLLKRKSEKKYVNGHTIIDPYDFTPANIIELDNELGKNRFENCFQHDYTYKNHYTHESKEFNNPLLNMSQSIVVHPKIIELFGEDNIKYLIQPKEIYSRVQIQGLRDFLENEDAIHLWNILFKDDPDLKDQFLPGLLFYYELWDVMYLLKDHHLLNQATFIKLLDNKENLETIYQILLILKEYQLLNYEKDINPILGHKTDLGYIHHYLIEMIQYYDDISIDDMHQAIYCPFNTVAMIDLYKAVNAVRLFDLNKMIEKQNEIAEFMYDQNNYFFHNDRITILFQRLKNILYQPKKLIPQNTNQKTILR